MRSRRCDDRAAERSPLTPENSVTPDDPNSPGARPLQGREELSVILPLLSSGIPGIARPRTGRDLASDASRPIPCKGLLARGILVFLGYRMRCVNCKHGFQIELHVRER
jgi:hypothetical protein